MKLTLEVNDTRWAILVVATANYIKDKRRVQQQLTGEVDPNVIAEAEALLRDIRRRRDGRKRKTD